MEGKGKRIDHLLQENDLLEEEFLTREVESLILMQIVAEKNFDYEKVRLLQAMEEKTCTIEDFKLKHASLEQCIASTAKLSVSALDEKHSSLSLKGKNAAMVLCWLLGNGCLFAWNGMLTSQDYYVTLFPDLDNLGRFVILMTMRLKNFVSEPRFGSIDDRSLLKTIG
ncbi:hypothetical protein Syun_022968 [Stephania yunnanensis]|uniref:Uncharacterized protein n=1 Tax=Stephania yunnanensis TaxID=152371 RepID=A0AAP0FAS5_9MAGN